MRRKMAKQSAGLLLFRRREDGIEVLLVHPGGPYWANKDAAAWSIPKGEFGADEDPLEAARREFVEETGFSPDGEAIPLAIVRQSSGKIIYAWAMEAEFDPENLKSNMFRLAWPSHSNRMQEFPEVDRAAWFPLDSATGRIHKGQKPLLMELKAKLTKS